MIDEKIKCIFILMQISNIINLLKKNQYEHFMVSHLVSVQVEMERQLTNLNHDTSRAK